MVRSAVDAIPGEFIGTTEPEDVCNRRHAILTGGADGEGSSSQQLLLSRLGGREGGAHGTRMPPRA